MVIIVSKMGVIVKVGGWVVLVGLVLQIGMTNAPAEPSVSVRQIVGDLDRFHRYGILSGNAFQRVALPNNMLNIRAIIL